jgi:membrane-associated protein
MGLVRQFIDLFLHLDAHLGAVIAQFGPFTYLILSAVVFVETGLVIMPFLPGDSLLFAIGTFAARGDLHLSIVFPALGAACIAGDNVNYWIGRFVGPKVFSREDVWYLNRKHLLRTQRFYEKHGRKTIILARFVPIVRTFAPFVAGIGQMPYIRFIGFSLVACVAWTTIFIFGGYFFGNLEIVKKNFTLVIMAIILISVMPAVIEYLRSRRKQEDEAS